MKISAVPQTITSLAELLDKDNIYCDEVVLQAYKTNALDIEFGPIGEVHHFLEPGKSATYPARNLSAFGVKALGPDLGLIVTIVRL